MTIKKQTILYLLPNILAIFVGLVTLPIIVKNISVNEYGDYTFITSVASLIGMFAGMGLSTAFQKYLYENKIGTRYKYATLKYIYLIYAISLLLIGILGIYIFSFFYEYPILFYIYIFFLMFCGNIKSMSFETLRKKTYVKHIFYFSVIEQLIPLSLLSICLFLNIVTIENILLVGMIRVLFVAFIYTYFFDIRRIKRRNTKKETMKEILKLSIPTMPAMVSNWIINLSDRLMLMSFKGSYIVGIYSVNLMMINYLNMLVVTLHNVFYPRFIKKLQGSNDDEVFLQTQKLLLLFVFFIICFVFFMKEFILIFTKEEYFTGNWIFLFFANSSFLFFATHMYQSSLLVQNKIRFIGLTKGSAAIINVGLNFVFIPLWGIYGTAISTMIAYMISMILTFNLIGFNIMKKTKFLNIFVAMNIFIIIFLLIFEFILNNNYVLEISVKILLCLIVGIFVVLKIKDEKFVS
ncbi:oligosaccharide flippase family protein [Aliarcobacter skirrowii]|uniref:oligosaccharide flippase family protein n=1 Tax=Aliarcobacter skirrowii TaxID=28200 RepID=UPI0029AA9EEF|nr:oligosaccharide flippase family protein [Aliarcobacter skirrowii]MDX4059293.1 oligosaccharide flippase family protein [Aliarcobacter skirrowii]